MSAERQLFYMFYIRYTYTGRRSSLCFMGCLYVLSPSFLSDPDAPSAGPVAPPTVMSLRGVVRLSMLLAADRQDGDGEGEMTTPPAAPVLTTLALT